ncbi:Putative LOC100651630, partial [Caligus rogercresseyi]
PVSKRPLRRSSDFLSSSTSSPSFFRQIQNHFKSNNATSSSNSNTIKRSRSTSENETRSKVQVFQLEQHCKNLEGELDTVKDEILKILSAKSSANKENESLKRYARAYESLVRENQSLKKEIHELRSKCGNGLSSTSPLPPQIHHDRSSPDGQEYYDSPKSPRVSSTDDDEGEDSLDKRDLAKLLETQKSELETERKGLLSKNSELEESLELMKTEFESMEDYWQEKLDKERSFYENQLSLSDSNFKELEIKMKEYEELMMTTEGMAHQDSDKLSTIAESVSLECQVTELEEELSDVRGRLKEVEGQKNQEINEISQAWKHKFEADYNIHLKEKEIYETKIRQMEKTLEDVKDQYTNVCIKGQIISIYIFSHVRAHQDICILQDSCHQMQEQIRRSKSVSPVPPALKLRLIEANESGTNKEKLSHSSLWLIHPPATGLPRYCNHSGSMSLDASFRYSDQSNSSSKQSNSMSHISDDVVDSVARAYQ